MEKNIKIILIIALIIGAIFFLSKNDKIEFSTVSAYITQDECNSAFNIFKQDTNPNLVFYDCKLMTQEIKTCIQNTDANQNLKDTILNSVAVNDYFFYIANTQSMDINEDKIINCITGNNNGDNPTICTLDVKECSDGSYVSRIAPDCEFEQCPTDEDGGISPIIFFIIGGMILLIFIVKKK